MKLAVIAIFIAIMLNEACVTSEGDRLAAMVPVQDFAGLTALWPQYEALADRSMMGGRGLERLKRALETQTVVLADRVIANYRSPQPTVRENQWIAARDALKRAVTIAPENRSLRASLRYAEGHLDRIDGEARKGAGQHTQAQHHFTDAVVAFREALALRADWPDPYLGLARTFIYGLDDVERGAEALALAEKHGHHPGERETTQLADGYRAKGEALERTARTLKTMPQEREYLTRAIEAYREALTKYSTIPGYGNVAVSLRDTQRRIERLELRLKEISKPSWWPWV
jgi:hypothetical protein